MRAEGSRPSTNSASRQMGFKLSEFRINYQIKKPKRGELKQRSKEKWKERV